MDHFEACIEAARFGRDFCILPKKTKRILTKEQIIWRTMSEPVKQMAYKAMFGK